MLPVHSGVRPEHLEATLGSIHSQSLRADEIVVVEDGPLRAGHHKAIENFLGQDSRVRRVKIQTNSGAGVANQVGLLAATGRWIAKVDADDINVPHRFERQLAEVQRQGLDVCGSAMGEFTDDPAVLLGVRASPISHDSIARRMRWNNPINHPTAFFRRTFALRAGGYRPMRYMQDYDLFARLLSAGAQMGNLAEVLVLFRGGSEMFARRRTSSIHRWEWELQRNLRSYGVITRTEMARNVTTRTVARVAPASLIEPLYNRLFRDSSLRVEAP
ncbi:glycosyltransferase [Nocardioides sp.]|uniref:glycosyltransferase n=1 Tax=Nocardioides sp. TaxID=35761 RepID=UPI00345DF368